MLTQEYNFLAFADGKWLLGLLNGEHERGWSVDLWLGITDKPLNSLSALHGGCCHCPCKTRLRLWLAFTGRELNPLDRNERFPSCYISCPLLDLS
jgi:hypothetical protein